MANDFSRTALTGLNAASYNLSIISNNIANVNTLGFKSSTANFYNLYASAGTNSAGMGVGVGQTQRSFDEGSAVQTGLATNLQITGDGFFVLKDSSGQTLYSRAGDFQLDKNGYLVNSQGIKVQGYSGDFTSGTLNDLQVDRSPSDPAASKNVTMSGNLDASGDKPFSQTVTVYDKRGASHSIQTDFKYDAKKKQWDVTYTVDGDSSSQKTSVITFDDSGKIATGKTFDLPVADGSVKMDFNKLTSYGGSSLAGPTADTDGYPAGNYMNITVEKGGKIYAHYSNGQSKQVGSVALAKFANNNGLQEIGNNNWIVTTDAGAVTTGVASKQGLGDINSGSLEGSNVNLSDQLVEMISAQRDFQSNAQVIKTGKTLDQAILNI